MSKIIIYDDENNVLIAELAGKIETEQSKLNEYITSNNHIANFRDYTIIKSATAAKHIRRLEKVFKYHKKK